MRRRDPNICIDSPGLFSHERQEDGESSRNNKAQPGCFGNRNRRKGFTLIEVIVAIVIVAILTTMLYSYFGSSITQSGIPIVRLGTTLQLQTVMENITADYKNHYNPSTSQHDLAYLKTSIGAENTDQANSYGTYRVIENHYIHFNSGAEVSDGATPTTLLKITLKSSTGEKLTELFSQS